MMHPSVPAAVAAIFFGLGTSASAQVLSGDEAADFVRRFCTTLIPSVAAYDPNAPGIWPPDDPAIFGALVTPELAVTIENALAHNATFERQAGGKGMLGDGVPWKSFQDAASECTAGAISGAPERPEVEIRYRYADSPNSGWTDTLMLARYGDEWRVDDIRYGAGGDRSSLRALLGQALDQ